MELENDLFMSQISHGRENAKPAKKACDGVDHHHDESVPEDGAVELVVRAEGYQTSEGDANRVEHLGCSVDPYLHQKDNCKCCSVSFAVKRQAFMCFFSWHTFDCIIFSHFGSKKNVIPFMAPSRVSPLMRKARRRT